MKLKYELVFVKVGDDVIAVPVGEQAADKFHGVIKVNSSAKEILELIPSHDSITAVKEAIIAKYPDDDPSAITTEVNNYFNELKKAGLLED